MGDSALLAAHQGLNGAGYEHDPSRCRIAAEHDDRIAELVLGIEWVLGRALTDQEKRLLTNPVAFEQIQYHVASVFRKVGSWYPNA